MPVKYDMIKDVRRIRMHCAHCQSIRSFEYQHHDIFRIAFEMPVYECLVCGNYELPAQFRFILDRYDQTHLQQTIIDFGDA